MSPDTAQFFPIMAYPGTEAYDWAIENGFLTTTDFRRWITEEGLHNCIISRPLLNDKELVDFCDRARGEFYLRPTYILSKMMESIKDPAELKRLLKGAKAFSRYILRGTF